MKNEKMRIRKMTNPAGSATGRRNIECRALQCKPATRVQCNKPDFCSAELAGKFGQAAARPAVCFKNRAMAINLLSITQKLNIAAIKKKKTPVHSLATIAAPSPASGMVPCLDRSRARTACCAPSGMFSRNLWPQCNVQVADYRSCLMQPARPIRQLPCGRW